MNKKEQELIKSILEKMDYTVKRLPTGQYYTQPKTKEQKPSFWASLKFRLHLARNKPESKFYTESLVWPVGENEILCITKPITPEPEIVFGSLVPLIRTGPDTRSWWDRFFGTLTGRYRRVKGY